MAKTVGDPEEIAEGAKGIISGKDPDEGELESMRIEPAVGGHLVHESFRPKKTSKGEPTPFMGDRKPRVFATPEEVGAHVIKRLKAIKR